jgi:antitoxin component YwqK of YwqJK toxin-antitoxin module
LNYKSINSVFAVFASIICTAVSAQEVEPVFAQDGEIIKGTFYYEDGTVSHGGTCKDGKLQGNWISYDTSGEKTAMANYEEGEKAGKWYFWSADKLTEVDYSQNRIAEVKTYKNQGNLVSRK